MNSWYNLLSIVVPTSVHLCDLEVQVSSKPCLILIQLLPNIEQFRFNDLRGYSFAIMYKVSLEHTERSSPASHTNEDVFGIHNFFVPGIVLSKNQSKHSFDS